LSRVGRIRISWSRIMAIPKRCLPLAAILCCGMATVSACAQQPQPATPRPEQRSANRAAGRARDNPSAANGRSNTAAPNQPSAAEDPAAEAIAVRDVQRTRPEQQATKHDRSPAFDPTKPAPLTYAFKDQPKAGGITGIDFARDGLNADKPFTTFDEVMKKESAAKPQVMAAQHKLLE